ncbi:MAG TPA: sigma-70 family RNA polymerase sigma factor [Thermoanaerobaculia bacterium]|nr:sigma-70 family RNA polymerase sigma factor [Thermoanaerobaculia bacterium]
MNEDPRIDRFRLVFEEHNATVYRFLYCMVGDADTARDLAQETFFRAYRAFDRFGERSTVSTWLCGIARNAARNHFRARKRAPVEQERDAESEAPERPDDDLLTRELRGAIREAILQLDEEKRTAFTLKILQQRTYEEIAAITGSAIAKLKTDVHRARLQLRAALSGHWRTR